MSHPPREPIREEDVQGLKYFRKLGPLFERLHQEGCGRDKAGNRQLFMDQYCSLVLLFMFNPCVRSLRALQQAAELKNVQRKLGCGRASLGSLSEATDVFDPERLREIIGELAAEVKPTRNVAREHVKQLLVAVDGSVVETLSTIAAAAYLKTKNGDSRSAWRLTPILTSTGVYRRGSTSRLPRTAARRKKRTCSARSWPPIIVT
jgi:hypothetical protein